MEVSDSMSSPVVIFTLVMEMTAISLLEWAMTAKNLFHGGRVPLMAYKRAGAFGVKTILWVIDYSKVDKPQDGTKFYCIYCNNIFSNAISVKSYHLNCLSKEARQDEYAFSHEECGNVFIDELTLEKHKNKCYGNGLHNFFMEEGYPLWRYKCAGAFGGRR